MSRFDGFRLVVIILIFLIGVTLNSENEEFMLLDCITFKAEFEKIKRKEKNQIIIFFHAD